MAFKKDLQFFSVKALWSNNIHVYNGMNGIVNVKIYVFLTIKFDNST